VNVFNINKKKVFNYLYLKKNMCENQLPNKINITVIDYSETQCAACIESKPDVFRSNCACHDLKFCEKCWVKWLTVENHYDFVDINEPGVGLRALRGLRDVDIHAQAICLKCNKKAFDIRQENENADRSTQKAHFFLMFVLILFACIGIALVLYSNVQAVLHSKQLKNSFYFLMAIDVGSAFFLLCLIKHIKVVFDKGFQTDGDNVFFFKSKNGVFKI
jgi:hypothetical protein